MIFSGYKRRGWDSNPPYDFQVADIANEILQSCSTCVVLAGKHNPTGGEPWINHVCLYASAYGKDSGACIGNAWCLPFPVGNIRRRRDEV